MRHPPHVWPHNPPVPLTARALSPPHTHTPPPPLPLRRWLLLCSVPLLPACLPADGWRVIHVVNRAFKSQTITWYVLGASLLYCCAASPSVPLLYCCAASPSCNSSSLYPPLPASPPLPPLFVFPPSLCALPVLWTYLSPCPHTLVPPLFAPLSAAGHLAEGPALRRRAHGHAAADAAALPLRQDDGL